MEPPGRRSKQKRRSGPLKKGLAAVDPHKDTLDDALAGTDQMTAKLSKAWKQAKANKKVVSKFAETSRTSNLRHAPVKESRGLTAESQKRSNQEEDHRESLDAAPGIRKENAARGTLNHGKSFIALSKTALAANKLKQNRKQVSKNARMRALTTGRAAADIDVGHKAKLGKSSSKKNNGKLTKGEDSKDASIVSEPQNDNRREAKKSSDKVPRSSVGESSSICHSSSGTSCQKPLREKAKGKSACQKPTRAKSKDKLDKPRGCQGRTGSEQRAHSVIEENITYGPPLSSGVNNAVEPTKTKNRGMATENPRSTSSSNQHCCPSPRSKSKGKRSRASEIQKGATQRHLDDHFGRSPGSSDSRKKATPYTEIPTARSKSIQKVRSDRGADKGGSSHKASQKKKPARALPGDCIHGCPYIPAGRSFITDLLEELRGPALDWHRLSRAYPKVINHPQLSQYLICHAASSLLDDGSHYPRDNSWTVAKLYLKGATILGNMQKISALEEMVTEEEEQQLALTFLKGHQTFHQNRDVIVELDSNLPCDCLTKMKQRMLRQPLKVECSACGMIHENSLVCATCGFSHYCSRECQAADYAEHKHLCKMFTGKLSPEEARAAWEREIQNKTKA